MNTSAKGRGFALVHYWEPLMILISWTHSGGGGGGTAWWRNTQRKYAVGIHQWHEQPELLCYSPCSINNLHKGVHLSFTLFPSSFGGGGGNISKGMKKVQTCWSYDIFAYSFFKPILFAHSSFGKKKNKCLKHLQLSSTFRQKINTDLLKPKLKGSISASRSQVAGWCCLVIISLIF